MNQTNLYLKQSLKTLESKCLVAPKLTPVTLSCIHNNDFNQQLFDQLYPLSKSIVEEDFDHWKTHAITNQWVHVFKHQSTQEILGFQFWRMLQTQNKNHIILFGGKLRYQECIRKRKLNIFSNLQMHQQLLKSNMTDNNNDNNTNTNNNTQSITIYRAALPNIFGFVSLRESIAHYDTFPFRNNSNLSKYVAPIIEEFVIENNFEIDKETGFVDVKQGVACELSQNFSKRDATQEYITMNPKWKQGYFPYIAWEMDDENVNAMIASCFDQQIS